jgi:hypothetical protein
VKGLIRRVPKATVDIVASKGIRRKTTLKKRGDCEKGSNNESNNSKEGGKRMVKNPNIICFRCKKKDIQHSCAQIRTRKLVCMHLTSMWKK